MLIIWKTASLLSNPLVLPPPEVVAKSMFLIISNENTPSILVVTAKRAFTGMGVAVAVGIFSALVLSSLTPFVRPAVILLQNIPLISWVLIGLIWFGFSDTGVAFAVFVAVLPIVYLNTSMGVANIDPMLTEMAESYKVPLSLRWYGVGLASVVGYISSGVSVAIAIMWKSVVMAEVFASGTGIGTELSVSRTYLQTDKLLAWTLLLAMLGYGCEYLWCRLVRSNYIRKLYRGGLRFHPIFKADRLRYEKCGVFELKNISKGFYLEGDSQVLKNIMMQLASGEKVCLRGPSGSGKTTLLRVMAGLTKPDSGVVMTGGRKIAVMFQESRLLPWFTVEENIIFVLLGRMKYEDAKSKAKALLDRLDIPYYIYPEKLSGGMKQAVSLARTLAVQGDLILLDEPFSAAGIKLKKRMWELINTETRRDCSLVIVTHHIEEVEHYINRTVTLVGKPAVLSESSGDLSCF